MSTTTTTRWLTAGEAAAHAHTTPANLRRATRSGALKSYRPGGGTRSPLKIAVEDLEDWMRAVPGDMNTWLTVEGVADLTGLSVVVCKRFLRAGVLQPHYRMVGTEPVGSPRFLASEVSEWWSQAPTTPLPPSDDAEDDDDEWDDPATDIARRLLEDAEAEPEWTGTEPHPSGNFALGDQPKTFDGERMYVGWEWVATFAAYDALRAAGLSVARARVLSGYDGRLLDVLAGGF